MVSVQSLNDTLKTMQNKHGSGEGASYEDIRDKMETFNHQLDGIKKIVGETKATLSTYAQVSKELNANLDRLWKEALEAPTCRVKINEIRGNLKKKNESAQRVVSQCVKRIEETTHLGSVESDLSELGEKLEEEPHEELKQQVESLDVSLKVFQMLKSHCSEKKVVKALEQLIFLRGLEMPFSPEELAGYVEKLTRTEAKIALDELVEKNCGLGVEYAFNMDIAEKGRVKNERSKKT